MSTPASIEAINQEQYWDAVQQALTTRNQLDTRRVNRDPNVADDFWAAIEEIDNHRRRARAGAQSGRLILDRLIASGQIMTPDELQVLETTEQMLVTGEPVLVQLDVRFWRVGIVASQREIYFSPVDRKGFTAAATRGYQAIPVGPDGYTEIQFGQYKGQTFAAYDIRPNALPPELGSGIGLPLTADLWSTPSPSTVATPDTMQQMYEAYNIANRVTSPNGYTTYNRAVHVGQEAVEANLGISLEELVELSGSTALTDYVTRPAL